jgi:hypothetical protein
VNVQLFLQSSLIYSASNFIFVFNAISLKSFSDINFDSSKHIFSFFILAISLISFNTQVSFIHQFASNKIICSSKFSIQVSIFLNISNSLGPQKNAFHLEKMQKKLIIIIIYFFIIYFLVIFIIIKKLYFTK